MDCLDLKYTDYSTHIYKGLQTFLATSEMSDITLAVEGKMFPAHQVILSLFSPYFRELFTSSPTKQSIFFMKNVKHHIIKDLLTFIYEGSVQIHPDDLPSFMDTADELQIQGLTKNDMVCQIRPEKQFEVTEVTCTPEIDGDLRPTKVTSSKHKMSLKSLSYSDPTDITEARPVNIKTSNSKDMDDPGTFSDDQGEENMLVKVLRTRRGHKIIANDYQYYVRDKSVHWSTWSCARRRRPLGGETCSAVLILSHDGRYFLKNLHNHEEHHHDESLRDTTIIEERMYRYGTLEELNKWRDELKRQNFQTTINSQE